MADQKRNTGKTIDRQGGEDGGASPNVHIDGRRWKQLHVSPKQKEQRELNQNLAVVRISLCFRLPVGYEESDGSDG
jgi:hypothetical protein